MGQTDENHQKCTGSANACPNCESRSVTERQFTDSFRYGFPPNITVLHAVVPLLECHHCGQAWTDYRAEELRTAAVHAYIEARAKQ